MTKQQAKNLIKRIEDNGGEANLYEGYSGRGMFGEQTYGVMCGRYDVPKKHKHRTDNMGLDMIVY